MLYILDQHVNNKIKTCMTLIDDNDVTFVPCDTI